MRNNLLKKALLPAVLALLSLWSATPASARQYRLASPDGKLNLTIETDGQLTWSIAHDGTTVLLPSAIALQGMEGAKTSFQWGENVKVTGAKRTSVQTSFPTPFYKKAEVEDHYNQLTLNCRGGYSVEFRAYDDGAAYRFVSKRKRAFDIQNETAEFNFAADYPAFIPYVNDNRGGERYSFSFESYYDETPLSKLYADSLAITPLMVCLPEGKKAVIMEAGLSNYPGMFLLRNDAKANSLKAEFAPIPLENKIGGHNRLNLVPTRRADRIYTAGKNSGQRTFPWRVVLVSTQDTQLANNDMAQRLAPPCRIDDTSWIKPGKVAWDWWNACMLTGVDFKAGMNTPTYKKYIDFAADNKLEYIIIDDGWSGTESLLEDLKPDIDLKELVAYGNRKGVGIILWASWRNLTGGSDQCPDTEAIMKHYAQMGIKGFKVDFFDRDDQVAIASIERMADIAARHHMVLDLHGLKPYGLQRAYPNVLNFEGVKGLENAKWDPIVKGAPLHDFPRYDVTIPYLRMLAGPLDYTPGAMRNATKSEFRTSNDRPMSMGTRVHQMAMYTVFEAPLQMLADSPSRYMKEQECTDFIAQVPTTFDETVVLAGEIGEYIALARRKGDTWYVAAMTNWTARSLDIDLSFLGEGNFKAEIFSDGVNADREATDYKKQTRTVTSADRLEAAMMPGGGWTARITR